MTWTMRNMPSHRIRCIVLFHHNYINIYNLLVVCVYTAILFEQQYLKIEWAQDAISTYCYYYYYALCIHWSWSHSLKNGIPVWLIAFTHGYFLLFHLILLLFILLLSFTQWHRYLAMPKINIHKFSV